MPTYDPTRTPLCKAVEDCGLTMTRHADNMNVTLYDNGKPVYTGLDFNVFPFLRVHYKLTPTKKCRTTRELLS